MFMMSIRLTPTRMLIGALAVMLVFALGVTGVRYFSHGGDAVTATKPAPENMAEKVKSKKAAGKTNDQRIAFIKSFGWEVTTEPAEVMEVIIPAEFDEVYNEYNSIQKLQGCDLTTYAGKRCKRYSYDVTNYPGKPENVRINLLVHNNKIIGGDVCSLELGGFMHGFAHE